jgi:hypothetical protein
MDVTFIDPVEPLTVPLGTAADMLGIGRSTAYDLARRDEFPVPVLKLGRRRVVSKKRLAAFIDGIDLEVAS